MLKTLREYLDEHHVRYVVMHHSTAYTAQEIAETAHIHGREFAKAVIARLDGELAIAVIPATEKLDLGLLAAASDAKQADIAAEEEFRGRFPESEIGAMPPFGNLYGMEVYLEEDMHSMERMTFNAGTHTELIQMKVRDFIDLVQPRIARLGKSYME